MTRDRKKGHTATGAFQHQCRHPGAARNSTLFNLRTPRPYTQLLDSLQYTIYPNTHPKKANAELWGPGPNAVSAMVRGNCRPSSNSVSAQSRLGTLQMGFTLFGRRRGLCT